ncbi:MAG TPA: monovalent cation/H+ antiporter subunit D family protein, partial [Verrucomicrobiales bacterium]|nr:monovalent cation/H+ antiporter subunit D family protein [Verrucomicrobiales bacterium]
MPEQVPSYLPLWACLASLLAVPAILFFRREPNIREAVTLLAGMVKFTLVLALLPLVLGGKQAVCTLFPILPGVPLQFRVDGPGLLFALVASGLWIVTTLYSIGYMRGLKEHSQTRFYAFFAVSLSATLGVAFAANLLTLYLFYEMLSLATWPLVTHHQDKEARTGGRTYLTYLLGTSIGFALPALIFCYLRSPGSLDFSPTGFLAGKVSHVEAMVILLLFIFGFAKSGLMPFHSWLPGAMVAPTPVSALLHAVAVVKVGVFCAIRVVTGVFGTEFLKAENLGIVVSWIAAFTVILSSLIALSQDNLKRRLAFSTIGQLAYIVLGVSLLSPNAITGATLHIAAHAVGKITLFFCAGAIFVATGKKYLSQMEGLGRQMPLTFLAFLIGSLSVVGFPPTFGFLSKFYLVTGAYQAGQPALLTVYLVSTFLNASYLLPPVYRAFFPREKQAPFTWSVVSEAPPFCLLPLCLTAALTITFFFFPGVRQSGSRQKGGASET